MSNGRLTINYFPEFETSCKLRGIDTIKMGQINNDMATYINMMFSSTILLYLT